MAKTVLVLGGIKTGKTGFAQTAALRLQKETGKGVGYIATARVLDNEMALRIARHREDRPRDWVTVEEPLKPASALRTASAGNCAVILDCMTLYMTNLLMTMGEEPDRIQAIRLIESEMDRFFAVAGEWEGTVFLISNLVENGLVSVYPFARIFQDVAGMTHQLIARRADEVYQMIAGIPHRLK